MDWASSFLVAGIVIYLLGLSVKKRTAGFSKYRRPIMIVGLLLLLAGVLLGLPDFWDGLKEGWTTGHSSNTK